MRNVSAVVVTRGDTDLSEILESIPPEWERVVWNNGEAAYDVWTPGAHKFSGGPGRDLAVYGRYHAALHVASHPIIFVQDDDCVLEPESFEAIVEAWRSPRRYFRDALVANMPQPFRHDFYSDHCLVGFGAMFERRLALSAFERYFRAQGRVHDRVPPRIAGGPPGEAIPIALDVPVEFLRTCDIVFTALTPFELVDVPYRNLPWASAPNRMWRQRGHGAEREHALKLTLAALERARSVRDR